MSPFSEGLVNSFYLPSDCEIHKTFDLPFLRNLDVSQVTHNHKGTFSSG